MLAQLAAFDMSDSDLTHEVLVVLAHVNGIFSGIPITFVALV